jgi:hypothetical protein
MSWSCAAAELDAAKIEAGCRFPKFLSTATGFFTVRGQP